MQLGRSEIRALIIEEIQREEIQRLELLQEDFWDKVQFALTIGGLTPVVGWALDLVNALISLARGNPFEMVLSIISIIPGVGDAIGTSGKVIYKIFEPLIDVIKATGTVPTGFGRKWYRNLSPENQQIILPALEAMKDASIKYGDSIQSFFNSVKNQDVDSLIRWMGKSPDDTSWFVRRLLKKILKELEPLAKAAAGDVKEILVFLRRFNVSDWVLDDEESAALDALQQDMTGASDEGALDFMYEGRSMTRYLMTEDMMYQELTDLIAYLENY